MSGNAWKIVGLVFFWVFSPFIVLAIGLGARDRKLTIEGLIYSALFLLSGATAGLSSLAVIVALVRVIQLRGHWLKRPAKEVTANYVNPPQQIHVTNYYSAPPPPPAPPMPPARVQHMAAAVPAPMPVPPTSPRNPVDPSMQTMSDLSSALSWVSSTAKQNKHRLPDGAYVTILEMAHTLDAIVDAEARQRSNDAGFEYELNALVREYLPGVLKGYLAVPANMVNTPQSNGRTPTQELQEQLDLLSGQADALHATRHGQASAELSSMGNFLRERFGHRRSDGFDFGVK